MFDDSSNIDLAKCYDFWEQECEEYFNQYKANEEEQNRIFIDIYGLQDELTPEAEDKDVSVRKAEIASYIKKKCNVIENFFTRSMKGYEDQRKKS